MPRYLFYVDEGYPVLAPEACELPNVDCAKAEALRMFGQIVRDQAGQPNRPETIRLRVSDDLGLLLFEMILLINEAPALLQD